jgi:hypothetical protein
LENASHFTIDFWMPIIRLTNQTSAPVKGASMSLFFSYQEWSSFVDEFGATVAKKDICRRIAAKAGPMPTKERLGPDDCENPAGLPETSDIAGQRTSDHDS